MAIDYSTLLTTNHDCRDAGYQQPLAPGGAEREPKAAREAHGKGSNREVGGYPSEARKRQGGG